MALLIGVLFTVSAGFAREYDGEDLLHEPWYLLIPLAASLVMGSVLFVLIHSAVSSRRKGAQGIAPNTMALYQSFLGLFLMTAPLAWLYAIQYEALFPPYQAMLWNLWTLALVATWRVLLISRVISVIYGVRFVHAFFVVMLFADVLMFIVALAMPKPIVAIMGGIRYSEVDLLVLTVTYYLIMASVLTLLVWLIGAVICINMMEKPWPEPVAKPTTRKHYGLLIFALASIPAWAPALWISQPDQWRKREADELLIQGQVAEAFQLMSNYGRDRYPPSWDPPPRSSYGEREPSIDLIIDVMRDNWPADWVAEIYLDKIRRVTQQNVIFYRWGDDWSDLSELKDEQLADSLRENDIPRLQFALDFDPDLTEIDREVITRLIQLATTEMQEQPNEDSDHGLPVTAE